jgi:hypothetical protein
MQYSMKIVSDAEFHAYIRGILKKTGFTGIYFCVYILFYNMLCKEFHSYIMGI